MLKPKAMTALRVSQEDSSIRPAHAYPVLHAALGRALAGLIKPRNARASEGCERSRTRCPPDLEINLCTTNRGRLHKIWPDQIFVADLRGTFGAQKFMNRYKTNISL